MEHIWTIFGIINGKVGFMKRKGFTLIELIVSIALMGLIAAGFIGAFSGYYSWMIRTKNNITIDSFDAQEIMERKIQNVKTNLTTSVDPDTEDYETTVNDVFLFASEFPQATFSERENLKAYVVEENISTTDKLVNLVGETRPSAYPVPLVDQPLQLFVRSGTNPTDSYDDLNEVDDKFEYYNYPDLTMYGLSRLLLNPSNSFYKNKHDWYVSEPGYIMPTPPVEEIDVDNDLGRLYPSFPGNYRPISIYSPELNAMYNSSLQNAIVRQHAGKHIIYTVTPYSKDLKRGILKASFPLYLMGPDVTNNLLVHLDPSTIRLSDPTLVEEDNTIGWIVKEVYNMRPTPTSANIYNAGQSDASKRPILVSDLPYGDPSYIGPEIPYQGEGTDDARVWGRAIGNRLTATADAISSMIIEDVSFSSGNYNMFMIVRKVDIPVGPNLSGDPIVRGIDDTKPWILGWSTDSILELSAPYNTDPINYPGSFTADYSLNSGEWNLLHIQFDSGKLSYSIYNLTAGKEDEYSIATDPEKMAYSEISTSGIEISLNGIEFSEVLIYGNLITEEISDVTQFLINKYNN